MSLNVNQVTLVGRLADNVNFTPAQGETSARATGRLIVNRVPSRNSKKAFDAIQIVAWGAHAENLAKYTAKGKELGIQGEIRENSVRPTKEGESWKNYTEVLVRSVSYGRDSTSAKIVKAIGDGTAATKAQLEQMFGTEELEAIIAKPEVAEALAQFTQGAAAQVNLEEPTVAAQVDTGAEVENLAETSPFND
jgi:single-stranded DNA-binding protein